MPTETVTHYRWDDIELETLSETISRKLVVGDRVMLAHVILKKGASVPAHHHENEQVTYILKGALKFDIEGQEVIVREGEVLHIPSHVMHGAEALEDTLDLDVFSPIRQDWLDKTDDYLRDT